jgi:hypothetical protein
MKFTDWMKYKDINDYKILEKRILIDNEKHWFAPKSIDDKLWYEGGTLLQEYYSLNGELLKEGVSPDQMGLDKFKGGIIVFSTDVNAVKVSKSKLVSWFKSKYETFYNRLMKNKKLSNIITSKFSKDIGSFTIGNFFKGRYVENGKTFDEKSTSIEILGVPSEVLVRLATEIARNFNQSTVLLKDKNTNKNILIDKK